MVFNFKNYWLLGTVILLLSSCGRTNRVAYDKASSYKVGSFTLSGLKNGSEDLVLLSRVNDSMLLSLNLATQSLMLFAKDVSGQFKLKKYIDTSKSYLNFASVFGTRSQHHKVEIFYANREEIGIIGLDGKLLYKHPVRTGVHVFDQLWGGFKHRLITMGDTLIAVGYKDSFVNGQLNTQNVLFSLLLNKDTFRLLRTYGEYPSGWKDYYSKEISDVYFNHSLWVIYPFLDTLYNYNLKTGRERKICIHNQDYIHPAKISSNPDSLKNFAYVNRNLVNNFQYLGICLIQKTGHLILLYKKPQKRVEKDKLPDFNSAPIYGIVLNKVGKVLKYISFGAQQYLPALFYQFPKGIAMIRFTHNPGYEKEFKFDVFSF